MHEKTIEEIISRYPEEVWPGCGLRVIGRQLPLDCGRLDLLMQDEQAGTWVVELKRGAFPPSAMPVLAAYVQEVTHKRAGSVRGLAVGTTFSPEAARAARRHGLAMKTFETVGLAAVAERHGLVLADARPRSHRDQKVTSAPRGPGSRRGAPDPAKVAALAALDERFPPSSIRIGVQPARRQEYWRAACPAASDAHVGLAARLTAEALRLCPQAAVGNRAAGGWTTVLAANGDVVAALDARRDYVDLSVLLPEARAQALAANGRLTMHHPRRNGRWVKIRVGGLIPEAEAVGLLAEAIAFEYPTPAAARSVSDT